MSVGASSSYFYKLGCMAALAKLGASLYWPPDQTFQRMREVESPATNEDEQESDTPRALPTRSNISGIWDDHDKRHMQKLLPDYENFTGV
jgi:hypothetical protein